jgi:putative ABC transport system permease protein
MRMTFRRFAFNNVIRNKRTYAAYFLSSAFSVLVFFVYAVFAFHPGLGKESIGSNVSVGLHVAEGIIYVFSFFFVLYSMSAFLKTRKKEFGLMVMYGMTDLQLRLLVFLENILIGFFATVTGITTGLIMAKGILLAAQNILELDNTLSFYWPLKAIILTLGAFMLLFITVSFFTVLILRGNLLIDLIKSSTKPKPEPKASWLLSLLAVLLLAGGYTGALIVKGMGVVAALIPVTIVVIIGTYLLFTQLSVYLINRGKSKRGFFWRRTNLLFLSDLAYRMKDNARTFFMVAILSTVAFSAIGSLVGFQSMLIGSFTDGNSFAFEYTSYSAKDEAAHLAKIEQELTTEKVDYQRYKLVLKEQEAADGKKAVLVKASEYNAIARADGSRELHPKGMDAVAVYYSYLLGNGKLEQPASLQLVEHQANLHLSEWVESKKSMESLTYYVVEDSLYEQFSQSTKLTSYYAFDASRWKETRKVGERLDTYLDSQPDGKSFRFFAMAYELHTVKQIYGAIMFVGLFIGAVFFVAAGSFLYFRLYADLEDDKRKFAAIMKLGLTDQELSKVITRQLLILFFVPIGVALVHGAVALTSLQRMFAYTLVKESAMVLTVFFLIQLVYFILIRTSYIRRVQH